MPVLQLPIIRGDKAANNADYRDLIPVNMTAVSRDIRGSEGYILSHYGLTRFGDAVGIDRGGYFNANQSQHYRVSGNQFISVDQNGGVTQLGAISGNQRASLINSFNSQAIVADGKMWLYNGASLTQVNDPNLGTPIDITWIDGYYFLTDGVSLYHTTLADESVIDPLAFATSEFSPDPTLAVDKTPDNQVIVFNRYTTEFFINRATDNFAFQRLQNKALKCGIVGTHCETELAGRFYIIGGSREEATSIHVVSPGSYQPIATREIDKILAKYDDEDLANAVLETRVEDNDKLLVARLPEETLIFNVTIAERLGKEPAWTIVKSSITGDGPWRGRNGVFDPRVSAWIYGDDQDGRLGVLDKNVATQYEEQVESIFYTPLIDFKGVSIDQIELDILPGHEVRYGTSAFISLTYDGVSYGKEWTAIYGTPNDYIKRFIARRLGYVRDTIGFKIRIVSPNRTAFSNFTVTYG